MPQLPNVLLAGFLVLLAGCSSPPRTVLSGDNDREMQSAIVAVGQNLPAARRTEFDQAVSTIIFSATDRRFAPAGDKLSPQAIALLRGRTASQVIEQAKLLRSVAAYY